MYYEGANLEVKSLGMLGSCWVTQYTEDCLAPDKVTMGMPPGPTTKVATTNYGTCYSFNYYFGATQWRLAFFEHIESFSGGFAI